MQQVFQYAVAHRGAGASRSNARWHPYTPPRSSGSASTPHYAHTPIRSASTTTTPAPAFQYLNTPASSVYSVSPTDVQQQQQQPRTSPTNPIPQPPTQCTGPVPALFRQSLAAKSQQHAKQTYVALLVDQAVRSLTDIWRPEGIPAVFATNTRITVASGPPPPSSPTASTSQRNPLCRRLSLQLPSPCSPSTSLPSPTTTSNPCSQHSSQQFTAGQSYISSTTVITEKELVPIRAFVHEVLRRSRTTCSVLQSALCYIEAIRKKVPELVEQEKLGMGVRGEVDLEDRIVVGTEDEATFDADATPSGNNVPTEVMHTQPYDENDVATVLNLDSSSTQAASDSRQNAADLLSKRRKVPSKPLEPLPPLPSPLLCPRRAFLAALILASKFLQDRCYSNRAWAKLSGLPPREVSRCERALGDALEWRLWVGKNNATLEEPTRPVLRSRSEGFIACTPSASQSMQIPSPPMSDAGASPEISRLSQPVMQRRTSQTLRRSSTAPDLYRNPYVAQPGMASCSTSASTLYSDEFATLCAGLAKGATVPQLTVTQPQTFSSIDNFSFALSQDASFLSTNATDEHTPRLGHSPASLPESNLDTPSTQYSSTIWSPTYNAASTENGGVSITATSMASSATTTTTKPNMDVGFTFFKNNLSTSPESMNCFNPGSWVAQQARYTSASYGFVSVEGLSTTSMTSFGGLQGN